MQPIAIGCFHHDIVCGRRRLGRTKERPPGIADITGKKDGMFASRIVDFEKDACRAEDVTGIEEGRAETGGDLDLFMIFCGAAKSSQTVGGIDEGIERHRP